MFYVCYNKLPGQQGEEFKWLGFREGVGDDIMKRGSMKIFNKDRYWRQGWVSSVVLWLYEYQNLIKTSGLWKFKIPKSEDKLKDKQKWAQGTYHHISHYKYEKWNSKIAKNGFLLAYQNNNTTLLFRQR